MDALIRRAERKSFSFEIESIGQLEELNSDRLLPVEFKPTDSTAFDVKIVGTKRAALCIKAVVS